MIAKADTSSNSRESTLDHLESLTGTFVDTLSSQDLTREAVSEDNGLQRLVLRLG